MAGLVRMHANMGLRVTYLTLCQVFFREELNDNLPKQMQAVMRVNVLSVED